MDGVLDIDRALAGGEDAQQETHREQKDDPARTPPAVDKREGHGRHLRLLLWHLGKERGQR
jgi:hypothetical protein